MSPFIPSPLAIGTDSRLTDPAGFDPAGIATCTLPAPAATTPVAAHLLSRHLLLVTVAGRGTAEVDFVEQPCEPGILLLAHPGQALRLDGRPEWEAVIITWEPAAHPLGDIVEFGTDGFFVPVRHRLAGADGEAIRVGVAQLAADCRRLPPDAAVGALLHHQLAALLLRIALLAGIEPLAADHPMARFRRLLERHYTDTRRVEDYAAQLGCSVRTLTRASLADTGRTAKQIVDDRVALEAKRLLAGTTLPVAEVGRRLGFPEPTNFGRFFHRETGSSPGVFRADTRHSFDHPTTIAPPNDNSP